jgi:hypothetical protein
MPSPIQANTRPRVDHRWLALLLALPLVSFALWTNVDPDLWGHTRFGLDILRDHRLPTVDPYSFTQDVPWVNHEWLHEVIAAGAYRVAGVAGLILLKVALVMGTLAVIGNSLKHASLPLQWVVVAFGALVLLPLSLTIRPQLWTAFFLVLECHVLAAAGPFWLLPILFVAWANLHGAWIVGAAALMGYCVAVMIFEPPIVRRRILLTLFASMAATLVTPYGVSLWRSLPSASEGARDIIEWMPLWTASPLLWSEWLVGIALIGIAAWRGTIGKPILAAAVVLAVGGLWLVRLTPLSVLANIVLGASPLARWVPASRLERDASRWVLVALSTIAMGTIVLMLRPSTRCLAISGDWVPDVTAAETLRSARGKLVLPLRWGDYAIWRLAPNLRVSIDGRREVHGMQTTRESFAVETGSPLGIAALERWNPDYVWLGAESTKTKMWLINHQYRIDFEGRRSYIAVRRELPALEPSPEVQEHCFPGP